MEIRSCAQAALAILMTLTVHGAQAQKYPGDTIPLAPSVPAPRYVAPPVAIPPQPAFPAPAPVRPAPQVTLAPEADAQARQLSERLPLDPATLNLQNRLPADVPGTIRRLGLRVPNGTRTDLRNHPATTSEIVNALAH